MGATHAVSPVRASQADQAETSPRWRTNFAQLIRRYGVAKLARDLQLDPRAVYQWVAGDTSPRPTTAAIVIILLRPLGTLSLEDIYNHRIRIRDSAEA